MNPTITIWAMRHNITPQALEELRAIFRMDGDESMPEAAHGISEAAVQSVVRLEAGRKGIRLWRNNVGVLKNEIGTPVRYGLGNDSTELNKKLKSGDLIGWRSILITPTHVGTRIAQFLSRECKRVDWKYAGSDHEAAQLKWAEIINADGGDAGFVTGEGTL